MDLLELVAHSNRAYIRISISFTVHPKKRKQHFTLVISSSDFDKYSMNTTIISSMWVMLEPIVHPS